MYICRPGNKNVKFAVDIVDSKPLPIQIYLQWNYISQYIILDDLLVVI